jgi:transposase
LGASRSGWPWSPDQSGFQYAGLETEAEAAGEETVEAAGEEQTPVEPEPLPKRKKNGHGRSALPEHLPRHRVEYPLADGQCQCEACGGALEKIGEELTRQLDYEPASFHVTEHVRIKYACKRCQGNVVLGQLPPQPIDKGLPGPGLLAHVLVSKYADHLPLHRLEGIFGRNGVEVSRRTMCDWVKASAQLLEPLYEAMRGDVLASKVIGTDDTPVPVQQAGRERTRKGRIWVYVGDGEHEHTVYDYTPTRNKDGPERFLGGYEGYLQADAYAGYDGLYAGGKITEVGCWAHARRKFYDAKPSDGPRALVALAYIRQLYEVEKEARDLSARQRRALRRGKARPVLEGFKTWLGRQQLEVLPKSPMGEAIGYAQRQWRALVRYLEDGDLNIDNNPSERALRAVVIGRKNYLFYGSDAGGKWAAILYSFVATCKRHGVDPFAYLRDVLQRLPSQSIQRLDELFPKNWKVSQDARQETAAA